MANNRLYIVHKPTGKKLYLGKRMGFGWYFHGHFDLNEKIDDFFDECLGDGDQDDFAIGMDEPYNESMIETNGLA